ncbi:MAG: AraC family transcriptional regulator [Muribaculaceae bacterium]|nr:AraC family transcriptional regulator [Muribaculaceae bacterium]
MGFELFKFQEHYKLPMFDLPLDFVSYDNINAQLLNFYTSFPCKIGALIVAYCIKGSVRARINLWDYTIKQGDFVLLTPGCFIQIHEASKDSQISFIGFSSSLLRTINFWKKSSHVLIPIFKCPVISVQQEVASVYGDAIGLCSRLSEMDMVSMDPSLLENVLSIFIHAITTALERQNNTSTTEDKSPIREQQILAEFLQLAFENYREEHKLSFYAREVNLTLSHFCNVIRKVTGQTPQEIIQSLIIMDAQSQLKGTDLPVSKIAEMLGFSAPTTFNRYFRTYTGMTPQEYRNKG